MVREFGADAAIDYKDEDVGARLKDLCPRGGFMGLFKGENQGTLIVKSAEPDEC